MAVIIRGGCFQPPGECPKGLQNTNTSPWIVFSNQLGNVLVTKVVAWQRLFAVYPHFAPLAQNFLWGTSFCRTFFFSINYLIVISFQKITSAIYVIKRVVTKLIGKQFYSGKNFFLNTLYLMFNIRKSTKGCNND